jgi:hypothetical protein
MESRYAPFLTAYKRYVDDICIVWSGNNQLLNEFLTYINTLHDKIIFTMEKERDGCLPFLDLQLKKNSDNIIAFEIYRKPSSTDNIIQFKSNSPYSHKFAVFNSLLYRLFNLPLSKEAFNKEYNIIKYIAINNGFSLASINKLFYKFLNKYKLSYNIVQAKPKEDTTYKCLTFYGNVSLQMAQFFKGLGVSIAFKTVNSLKSHLVKTKDKTDQLSKSGVYSLECGECSACYVGQTGRKISTRVQEHLSLFNKYKNTDTTETKSAFANHLLNSGHKFSITENVNILHQCPKGKKLDLLEKMEITKAIKSPILDCVNDVFNFEPSLIFNNLGNN